MPSVFFCQILDGQTVASAVSEKNKGMNKNEPLLCSVCAETQRARRTHSVMMASQLWQKAAPIDWKFHNPLELEGWPLQWRRRSGLSLCGGDAVEVQASQNDTVITKQHVINRWYLVECRLWCRTTKISMSGQHLMPTSMWHSHISIVWSCAVKLRWLLLEVFCVIVWIESNSQELFERFRMHPNPSSRMRWCQGAPWSEEIIFVYRAQSASDNIKRDPHRQLLRTKYPLFLLLQQMKCYECVLILNFKSIQPEVKMERRKKSSTHRKDCGSLLPGTVCIHV